VIEKKILAQKEKIDILFLVPSDLFNNKYTFPLKLERIQPRTKEDLKNDPSLAISAINGEHGINKHTPHPWTFIDQIPISKTHSKYPNVKTLKLIPPKPGKEWPSQGCEKEFERVKAAFEFFVGKEGMSKFKLEKIELLQNDTLEKNFLSCYEKISKQEAFHNKNPSHPEWREAILSQVCNLLNNFYFHCLLYLLILN
jgi:hypothetical protein